MRPGTPGFRGERLREGREARGLTATTLASLVGVTRAAISQYETDVQSPSPQAMRGIARALNLSTEFFLSEGEGPSVGVVFYRSMSSATKRARIRAERRYGWLRKIVAFLRSYIEFPSARLPDLDLPDDPVRLEEEDVENAADATRMHFGLGDGPVSNVAWLLENHGVVVSRCDLDAEPLDAFSEWRATERTGYVVLNSGKASAARSRFDVAHELGHLVLHRRLPRLPQREDHLFKRVESQANRFASVFLLPADTFGKDVGTVTLDRCRVLKTKWCVSIQAMLIRARQMGLVTDEQAKRLWMNLGRRKWRTREPFDDVLPPEEPRFLRRSVEMLVQNGIVDPLDVPRRLTLPASDIEELTGLPAGFLGTAGREIRLVEGSDAGNVLPFGETGHRDDPGTE
jgi:Zn-dependent peptidase ImmA (M78 family)/transcriptional regulator with XRE-family HTH domain